MRCFLRGLLFLLMMFPLMASPIEATFVGVNGTVAFGYYVGPYYGKLGQQSVVFDCVDFANEVYFGQQWAVNLSPIDTQSDLVNTRYGALENALQLYQEAAWLTEQYSLNPESAYGDIQATIWQLFDQYAPPPSTGYWLNLAQANYAIANYNNFFVVTNVGPVNPTGQVQEFLTVLDPAMSIYPAAQIGPMVGTDQVDTTDVIQTPEPELMGSLGLGLIGLGVLIRAWRNRRKGGQGPPPHT
jgi:hypothetical protein